MKNKNITASIIFFLPDPSQFGKVGKDFLITLFFISVFTCFLNAQVKRSVYSMFGVGQLTDNSIGINKSLGGTGIAFQSGSSINYLNPASYLGIPPGSLAMELGLYGIYNISQKENTSQSAGNISISYFSASLYFTRWWAFSLGIIPFSSVYYVITSNSSINGELTSFKKEFKGSGGLNRVYFGNSFKVLDNLAVGFNASIIFGPITQTETALSSDNFTGYELKNERSASSFYLDYGIQYLIHKNNWLYTVGFVYGASTKINTSDVLQFTYNSTTDSLEQENVLDIKIPTKLGLGISVNKQNIFRAGFDYEWGGWSKINFSNPNLDTKNSNRFSIGVEYSPNINNRDNNLLSSLVYRFGANYKNSYMVIDKTPINSAGITLGIGIPFERFSMINFSLEYGREGTLNKGLVRNDYWTFYFNISLHELWLTRPD